MMDKKDSIELEQLERGFLNVAVRRKDKRFIPLLIEVGKLMELGYDKKYLLKMARKNYDGREILNTAEKIQEEYRNSKGLSN